jgi:hypothetical protein
MTDPVQEALNAYDAAVLRFWYGSSEDVLKPDDFPAESQRIAAIALTLAGKPTMRSRNWNEIVAPAREAVEAAVRADEREKVQGLVAAARAVMADVDLIVALYSTRIGPVSVFDDLGRALAAFAGPRESEEGEGR